MARTDSTWIKVAGSYLRSATATGLHILIAGTNKYLNFGSTVGSSGYGFRDNAGTIQFKHSGGSWADIGTGGVGGGITTEQAVDAVMTQINAGTHTGITITYDDAGNAIAFALSDEVYTTAEQTKLGHISVTQAVNLDTMESDIAGKADSSSLATVATSGDYTDLSNTPDLSVYDNFEAQADSASFPATGSADVLYLETSTGLIYRWNGSGYSVVSAQLALGETSSTAYRGDRGKIAYDHTSLTNNPHSVTKSQVGLGNVDNTSDADKPVSTAQQTALNGKANTSHTHSIANVTGLQSELDAKQDINWSLPASDHTAVGNQTDAIDAGATIVAGEAVYLASDGEWAKTDASATATAEALLAIALEAGSDNSPMLVALPNSFVRDDSWNWTIGATIYLSETAGDLTETAPSTTDAVVRVVGYAVTADIIYLQPQQGVIHA